jgi:hypothetical protein
LDVRLNQIFDGLPAKLGSRGNELDLDANDVTRSPKTSPDWHMESPYGVRQNT